jgi:hypothetical protein
MSVMRKVQQEEKVEEWENTSLKYCILPVKRRPDLSS